MGYIKSDFKRCFTSVWFFVAIIGVGLSYFIGDFGDLGSEFSRLDVLGFLNISSAIGGFSELTILLGALPFAMSFCEDLSSNFIKFLVIRGNIFKYSLSKIITCISSSIASITLGRALLIFILQFKIPLVSTISANYEASVEGTFGFLLTSGNYISYFLVDILFIAITCSIFAIIGLVITTYLPNKFLAITAPIISYFLLYQLAIGLALPSFLKIDKIMKGIFIIGSPSVNIVYVLLLGIIAYLIGSYVFYKGVKKNVEK